MRSLRAALRGILPARLIGFAQRARSVVQPPDLHTWNERVHREEFLRRALVALKFNGITGDYAEFGCCGAMTFRIVHQVLTRYPYDVGPFHQWAFDSFQGLPPSGGEKDAHPMGCPLSSSRSRPVRRSAAPGFTGSWREHRIGLALLLRCCRAPRRPACAPHRRASPSGEARPRFEAGASERVVWSHL